MSDAGPRSVMGDLARQARLAVSVPAVATLEVHGPHARRLDDPTVSLSERDGIPTFLCGEGSTLVEAARAGALSLLSVRSRSAGLLGPQVAVFGRLEVLAVEVHDDGPVAVVQLQPRRISVACRADGDHDLFLEVPLESYRLTQRPVLDVETVAGQIIEHANAEHPERLEAFVSERFGVPRQHVAAATLVHLDGNGAVIGWIDVDGAHRATVAFPEPVACPHALATALRAALEEPSRDSRP